LRGTKKAGETCASPAVESAGTPLREDCRSSLAFPTSLGSAFVLPFGCQARVSLPPFFIDAGASISRDRVSLSSHPHGTTAFLGRTRSGRRTLYHLSAGRSFHPPAFRRVGLPAVPLSLRSGSFDSGPFDSGPTDPFRRSGGSGLATGGFHLTGDSSYSCTGVVSKGLTVKLLSVSQLQSHQKWPSR
jgi:hypothetical protein